MHACKPRGGAAPLLALLAALGCSGPADEARRVEPIYDESTGRLELLKYDANGDARIDTWSYMDGTRVIRVEIDRDGDDRVDRWEYYDADQRIEKVGTSRANDGTADSWAYYDASDVLSRVELSTKRDGAVDRIEYYENGVMTRADADMDADGRVDKWETYDGQRLVSVAFDTMNRGTPDRRLVYARDGSARLEVLPSP